MSWLRKIFELNPAGTNWARGVLFLDVMLAPLVLFWSIGHQQYLISALFGALLALVADPGGGYGYRALHIAIFAAAGAGLTALGFGIGADAWGWVVLAAFVVTLLAGLTLVVGVHRFVAAGALNLWFIIALAVANAFHQHPHITSYTWAQTLAWTGGAALWIVVTFIEWLIRGRADRPCARAGGNDVHGLAGQVTGFIGPNGAGNPITELRLLWAPGSEGPVGTPCRRRTWVARPWPPMSTQNPITRRQCPRRSRC